MKSICFTIHCSLVSLHDIDNLAHDFAVTDGINSAVLTELRYDWGGNIEIRQANNLLATLIEKNQQSRTHCAHLIYAQFYLQPKDRNIMIQLNLHEGKPGVLRHDGPSDNELYRQIEMLTQTWLTQLGCMDSQANTKKIISRRCSRLRCVGGVNQVALLSAPL